MTLRNFIDAWDTHDKIYTMVQIYLGDEEEPSFEGLSDDIPEKYMDRKLQSFSIGGYAYKVFFL